MLYNCNNVTLPSLSTLIDAAIYLIAMLKQRGAVF